MHNAGAAEVTTCVELVKRRFTIKPPPLFVRVVDSEDGYIGRVEVSLEGLGELLSVRGGGGGGGGLQGVM